MNRIKTLEATESNEEFDYSSPVLGAVSKENPYSVPAGYFDGLAENVLDSIRNSTDHLSAKEELASLSPLLSGLK